ncbi:DHA1 family bicyclomycin/chloramphenicol resistance-like MFS transporter [Azospirillum agricola]|uniref:multidrug effflux MFS transporter n=1 Tax=Azospirillum agricola TaxID=1720247 RepID=UPI001AE66205|nr:multidrug effflux MFS transporter [Azospirillum agricola]MBP2231986.1 DHA1 family bicyclomycin/chloramphenicol resistance-like MFS transporter [Azospirillum agricola]
MLNTSQSSSPPPSGGISFVEFVTLIAAMMALTALSIDIMLVALPDIAHALGGDGANDRQLIITAYMLGFAAGQPFAGPLSDRFGRKPVLAAGLVVFAVASLAAVLAPSFGVMLAARAIQGFGAAAPRIVAVAIVRDRFAGRDMARVMSFAMMVFIIVPVIAPAIGELILHAGSWPWVFAALFLAAAGALAWSALRLPETRHAEDRLPLSPAALGNALRMVVTTRQTVGYTVAMGFMFGSLLSYIGSAQQVFVDIYGLGTLFPVVFGAIAAVMAVASLTNARLVGRLGMRRVSHAAMLGFLAACLAMAAFGFPERPPLLALGGFLAATFYCFGLIAPNFNALTMEPLGHIAGMGSSFTGFYSTAAGALFGWGIGQAFDGTVRPMTIGFTVLAVLAVLTVLKTEGGVLFRTHAHVSGAARPAGGE